MYLDSYVVNFGCNYSFNERFLILIAIPTNIATLKCMFHMC